MSPIDVLVYDDHPEIANNLANKIRAACPNAKVRGVERARFHDLIALINRRRTTWRETRG